MDMMDGWMGEFPGNLGVCFFFGTKALEGCFFFFFGYGIFNHHASMNHENWCGIFIQMFFR